PPPATKSLERPLTLKSVVQLTHRVWVVRFNHLNPAPLPLNPLIVGSVNYNRWRDRAVQVEGDVLCALGFTLYAATKDRSQLYIPLIVSRLTGKRPGGPSDDDDVQDSALLSSAMRVADDAGMLDLCVRYPPDLIALACVWVAGTAMGGRGDPRSREIKRAEEMWKDDGERSRWEECANR
ncbi:hypothetical protein TrRE_jg850, partial [Triparma retinervis]